MAIAANPAQTLHPCGARNIPVKLNGVIFYISDKMRRRSSLATVTLCGLKPGLAPRRR